MKKDDLNHLGFIYERMNLAHCENENIDYMLKFKSIIDKEKPYLCEVSTDTLSSIAIDHVKIEAIEKAACFDGDIVRIIVAFNDAYRERSRVAKEIVSCKNEVDLKVLHQMFDQYSSNIKLILGLI